MKKFLLIGRDPQCDIVLSDDSDVTSRQHALLEVGKNGNYYITDKSRNGTYVNGIKMAQGERIPIKRNDTVSFSHISELDWSCVPVDHTLRNTLLIVFAALVVIAGSGFAIWHFTQREKPVENDGIENIGSIGTGMTAPDDAPSIDQQIIENEPEKKSEKPKKSKKAPKKSESEAEEKPAEEKEEIINAIY